VKPFATEAGTCQVTLNPGELYFTRQPAVISTLLGSCIAITLWHPRWRMGGMCHYLLTDRRQYKRAEAHPPGHYATDAIEYFLQQARSNGCRPREFEVKLFGGGNMFDGIQRHLSSINVAQVNASEGRRLLQENGFSVKAADVGGSRYRKIYFELASGVVWVQYGGHRSTPPMPGKKNESAKD
jgi:chemotaxis protein CheD